MSLNQKLKRVELTESTYVFHVNCGSYDIKPRCISLQIITIVFHHHSRSSISSLLDQPRRESQSVAQPPPPPPPPPPLTSSSNRQPDMQQVSPSLRSESSSENKVCPSVLDHCMACILVICYLCLFNMIYKSV